MKAEKIKQEILLHVTRKTVLGLRCYPELKNRLAQEAISLGLTVSELTENILMDRPRLVSENEGLKVKVLDLQKEILETRAAKAEKARLTLDNKPYLKEVQELRAQTALFKDPRLLQLFSELEGKTDSIGTANGSLQITYNTPTDLVRGLIYSFILKKK